MRNDPLRPSDTMTIPHAQTVLPSCALAPLFAALLGLSLPAAADTTFVIGANASTTGRVLVAQNIDMGGMTSTTIRRVGAAQHKWSDVVPYVRAKGGTVVRQIPHTLGFALTLTDALHGDGSYAMRESYLNDEGVLILSNPLPHVTHERLTPEEAAVPVNGLIRHPDPAYERRGDAADGEKLPYPLPSAVEVERLLRERKTYGKETPEPLPDPERDAPETLAAFEASGLTYGIMRLMAERGKTSRSAVEEGVRLIERHGWAGEPIQITVADEREAWLLALMPGRTAVARRVGDAEAVLTTELQTLGRTDLLDEKNTVVTELTRNRARALWETAAKDLPEAIRRERTVTFEWVDYMEPPTQAARLRAYGRTKALLTRFAGLDDKSAAALLGLDYRRFTSHGGIAPKDPVSPEAVKAFMRSAAPNLEGTEGVANAATVRSAVFSLRKPAWATRVAVAGAHPAVTPYVPMHPLALRLPTKNLKRSSETGTVMSAEPNTPYIETSARSDFDFSFRDARFFEKHAASVYAYDAVTGRTAPTGNALAPHLRPAFADYEKRTAGGVSEALFLAKEVSEAKGAHHLVELDAMRRAEAEALSFTEYRTRHPVRVMFLADSLKNSDRTVKAHVLSTAQFDATKLERKTLKLGSAIPLASGEPNHNHSEATAMNRLDVNGDGRPDAVVTFPVREALKGTIRGYHTPLYITGRTKEGRPFIGFDSVLVR